MPQIDLNAVRMESSPDDELTAWTVAGMPGWWWPTKLAAEMAARQHFPDEDAYTRYLRVSFAVFRLDR